MKKKDWKTAVWMIAVLAAVFCLFQCAHSQHTDADAVQEPSLSPPADNPDELRPEQLPEDHYDLSYEVKFLLDADQVLDRDHRLKKEWLSAFRIQDEYQPIEVCFVETENRSFQKEGWTNRMRLREGRKKIERTYKKRYPVSDGNIEAALAQAQKDGFEIPGKSNAAESNDKEKNSDRFEAEIDWEYENMILSLSWKTSGKLPGTDSLFDLSDLEIRDFMKNAMPEMEAGWKQTDWGYALMEQSVSVGPLRFLRAQGTLLESDITVEIWPLSKDSQNEDQYLVELSFKTDQLEDARKKRQELTSLLDEKKILLHRNSTKTSRVLDAWLK